MITMSYIVISSLDYVYTDVNTSVLSRPYFVGAAPTVAPPYCIAGHLISLKSDYNIICDCPCKNQPSSH